MCQQFILGKCNLDDNCSFAHNEYELKSTPELFKTMLCMSFMKSKSCSTGDKCRFAHGEDDLR